MATKKDVLEIIEQLPDDATVDDIMYELYFLQRVERGLKESAEGRTVPHEETMRRVAARISPVLKQHVPGGTP